jgi:hypothetical protein
MRISRFRQSKTNRLILGSLEKQLGANAILLLSSLKDLHTYCLENGIKYRTALDRVRSGSIQTIVISSTPFIIDPDVVFEFNLTSSKEVEDRVFALERFADRITASKVNLYNTRNHSLTLQEGEKAIIRVDDDGNVCEKYLSPAVAARDLGITKANIYKCLRGERKKAGGWVWKYAK